MGKVQLYNFFHITIRRSISIKSNLKTEIRTSIDIADVVLWHLKGDELYQCVIFSSLVLRDYAPSIRTLQGCHFGP